MHDQLSFLLAQLRTAWRFRWPAMAAVWAVSLGGWLFVSGMPDLYEAKTRVFVDSSSQLRQILGDQIVEPDVDTQLNYVREAMLGSVLLERVARSAGLALGTGPAELAGIVERLQGRITLEVTGGDRYRQGNIYMITYRDQSGAQALNVVRTLLDTFVEDTLGANRDGADSARTFLVQQVQDVEGRLAESEQRLADFKREHADVLPDREGGYFQRLQAETAALEDLKRTLAQAQSRRARLLAQLRGDGQTAGADAASLLPGNIEARIREHEARLEELLLTFTPRHPDVTALEDTLTRLRRQRDEQLAAFDPGGPLRSTDPVYQALQISRNDVEVEIASLNVEVAAGEERVGHLRTLMGEVPEVEAELARLNRDYEVVHALHQSLLRSLETEQLTRRVVETDQTEFRVIEPPTATTAPVLPNRPLLLLGVLGVALGAGAALAFLLSQIWPVFPTSQSLRDVVGLPVLGSISVAFEDQHRARNRLAALSFALSAIGLVALFGVAFFVEVVGVSA